MKLLSNNRQLKSSLKLSRVVGNRLEIEVKFTLLQSKFFPRQIFLCILENGNLAGKNLLCKESFSKKIPLPPKNPKNKKEIMCEWNDILIQNNSNLDIPEIDKNLKYSIHKFDSFSLFKKIHNQSWKRNQ